MGAKGLRRRTLLVPKWNGFGYGAEVEAAGSVGTER
jgi:hypothetical protein